MVFEKHDYNWIVFKLIICWRGGRYPEDDAKAILVQILDVVAFCHLQGVVHRDLKPEVWHYEAWTTHSYLIVLSIAILCFYSHLSKFFFALQNFLFVSKDEDAVMKVIDFGLSDFVRPGNMNKSTYYSQSQVVVSSSSLK